LGAFFYKNGNNYFIPILNIKNIKKINEQNFPPIFDNIIFLLGKSKYLGQYILRIKAKN
jgi:hypothetical protein